MVEYSSRSTGKHSSKLGLLSPEDKRSTGFEDKMSDMIAALVHASEKAAKIARACRLEESLFGLLIEEKKEGEKNKKFVTDFKTLADVLVQEVIKHDVGKQCIFAGEKIHVKVCETEQETAKLLSKVLDGNMKAAEVLARSAHQNIVIPDLNTGRIDIPQDRLGVWVDPIDSTFQYIKGVSDSKPNNNIYSCGLQCVTILIGVYDLHSGTPIMGVVNQPFAVQDPETQRWSGQYYWGISYGTTNVCSLGPHSKNGGVSSESNSMPAPQHLKKGSAADLEEERFSAVLSTGETVCVQTLLKEACGDNIHYAAGAGYKSLCVVLGFVDVYVFSEDTTFKWDCCSPHAILKSLGGGMADLKECLRRRQDGNREDCSELVYNVPVQDVKGADRWANKGGLVAYRSHKHLEAVLNLLSGISV
ncbi:inositol polyphosphate 1-phosphatase-like isoform X2 [Polyodon spathula]|uniref:inositol polyphosphate 1-phosphatase-like isoform X2 n=1 Tax=Polyodon spathula TaxID=7913 RepID=UPI001B7E3209|nr:inositol polyphosphate 1-phosphatase-like isoform X2 [Polyodon spathula]